MEIKPFWVFLSEQDPMPRTAQEFQLALKLWMNQTFMVIMTDAYAKMMLDFIKSFETLSKEFADSADTDRTNRPNTGKPTYQAQAR